MIKIADQDNNRVIVEVTERQFDVLTSKGYIHPEKTRGACEYRLKKDSYNINVNAYASTNDEGYLDDNSKELGNG